MFEHLQRELRRLGDGQQSISVPIESDSEGYWDKECPSESCLFQFKVHADDWKNIVRDEEVFCPSCRHTAPSRSWFTTEQVEAAKQYALNHVKNRINDAMRADAAVSQRNQRPGSFLRITLEARGGRNAVLMPIASAEPLRLRTSCEACGCRYSYVGAAYFCPSCGLNSATHTFQQTLASIRTAASIGDTLRQVLGPDETEVMTRSLREKAMQDTVTSFQRLSEQLYASVPNRAQVRRNVFQNLEAGSALWREAVEVSYEDILGLDGANRLGVFFQQRHLLAHQQGVVDADYIAKSGDTAYAVGQRLVIAEATVLEFAGLVERLGSALIEKVRQHTASTS
jgi:uncharacterized Zn finger protein (UPF0148 family)